MKETNIFKKPYYALLIIVLLLTSCDLFDGESSEKEDPTFDTYLVEFQKKKDFSKMELKMLAGIIDIASEDIDIPFLNKIDNDVSVYTIKYNTSFEGEEIIASGLAILPKGNREYPLLSFQNGTNVENRNAPSVNPDYDLYKLLNIVASTGFIISMPDYIGFGETADMFHPYMHKKSTVSSVIDMLRAVKELAENQLKLNVSNNLYLSGYSQGGWSTMAVQKEIETQLSSEFNLKASSCGAGPYNLLTVNDYVMEQDIYSMPYFLAYVFNTYINMGYIATSISSILQEPYASKISTLFDGEKSGGEINSELTKNVDELFTSEYLNGYKTDPKFAEIRELLRDNSIDFWRISTPTKLFHGTSDQSVPFATSQEAYQRFIELGVDPSMVEFIQVEGKDHTGAIIPTEIESIQWFLDIKNGN